MFLKRNILGPLAKWKTSSGRKPLLLRGARQVGKTTVVREFARVHFANFIEINFEKDGSARRIFEGDVDVPRVLARLEARSGTPVKPGETLIFLDEVQECEDAIKYLRYFFEEFPSLHVLAAGSLLEFALQEISFPVGRVDSCFMYPLSFSEFLAARNRQQLIQYLPHYEDLKSKAIDSEIAQEIYKTLREYYFVGGMPAIVAAFCERQSFIEVRELQGQIMLNFVDDTRKYVKADKQLENIANVLRQIPKYIGQEVTYTTLGEHDSHVRTKKSTDLLSQALLVTKVSSTSPASVQMAMNINLKHFKFLFLDIGLASYCLGCDPEMILSGKDLTTTLGGKLAEQFVGQQLLTEMDPDQSIPLRRDLFCWIRPERTAKAEVDYLLVKEKCVVPVEVKSSALGRIRSLQVLLAQFPSIETAVVLAHTDKIEWSGLDDFRIVRAPIYTRL